MVLLVLFYDSKTGYTEIMAKAIAQGVKTLKNVEVYFKKINESIEYSILNKAKIIAIGSPSHHGHVTPEMLVFLFSLQEAVNAGKICIKGKVGFAFGSYSWDGGICIEKLHAEMKNLGLIMTKKPFVKSTPIPDSSTKEEFIKDCQMVGSKLLSINTKI
jgi:flavorubredoxin